MCDVQLKVEDTRDTPRASLLSLFRDVQIDGLHLAMGHRTSQA